MKSRFKDQLLPGRLELVLYGIVTLVIIFITNLKDLAGYLLNEPNIQTTTYNGTFGAYFERIVDYVESLPFLPNSAVFVFWSLVGLVVYSLAQSIYNVYAEIKNDIDMTTHFLHPINFIRWQFWAEVAIQFLAHVSLYALVVLWGFLVGYVLVPIVTLFTRQFAEDPDFENLPRLASGILLLYIGVLVFALILKIFFKRKQLVL